MARVIAGMTMSLDGFINDRDGGVDRLYPDVATLNLTDELREEIRDTGAVVMGRRSYEMGKGDYTGYAFQVPIFVLTHRAPDHVAKGRTTTCRSPSSPMASTEQSLGPRRRRATRRSRSSAAH